MIYVCSNTGYTVDHLPREPFGGTSGGNKTIYTSQYAYYNSNAKLLTRLGIGTVRFVMPAVYADTLDYCMIRSSSIFGTASPSGNDAHAGTMSAAATMDAYYFVTGIEGLNNGVVELSIELDCYTTLAALGINLASYGGMLTRVPTNLGGVYTQYNTLVEPFTLSHNLNYVYTIRDPKTATTAQTVDFSAIPYVLSPYDLTATDESGNVVKQTRNRTALLEAATNGTGTVTGDASTSTSSTTTNETGTTTITYGAATASETYTNFVMGSKTMNLGLTLYRMTPDVVKNISQLYAAGITNAVVDAYSCYGSPIYSGSAVTTIYGLVGTLTIARPSGVGVFSANDKSTYYGAYITIVSDGTGESQTLPYYEVAQSDGSILIDVATDPSPSGKIYMRLRRNTETVGSTDSLPRALYPGGISSGEWRRVTVTPTNAGQGVEAGQAFRLAQLDIESNVARLNQAATAAQYDLTAGNGYLMKNAGNEYGLASLNAQMTASYANYGINAQQNILNAATSAAGGAGSFTGNTTRANSNGTYAPNIVGAGAAAANAIGAIANAQITQSSSDLQLALQESLYGTQSRQLSESGAYNRSLLTAQRNAGTAQAQAAIDKINLTRQQITEFPSIDLLSLAKGGMIQGNNNDLIVIWTTPATADKTLLKRSLEQFGQTVYMNPEEAVDTDGYPITPNEWNFYKLDIPGNTYPDVTGVPAWVIKGAISQISGGVWFKGDSTSST